MIPSVRVTSAVTPGRVVRLFGPLLVRLFVLVLLVAAPARAQERRSYPEGTVRVELVDGTTLVGTIVREDGEEVVVRAENGVTTTVPRGQVRAIESIAGERFFRADPNRSRLLFAPTARPLAPGSGYLAFYEIFVPFAAVSVHERVILAGGVTINPGEDRAYYAAPKVTVVDRPGWSAAVGGVGVVVTEGSGAGLLYALSTHGGPARSATVGIAFGYAEGELSGMPTILLGGEYQLSNSVKLLTENYVFTGVAEGLLVSGGVRFFGDHLAADVGLITAPFLLEEAGPFPFVPWLGFAYNW